MAFWLPVSPAEPFQTLKATGMVCPELNWMSFCVSAVVSWRLSTSE